MNLGPIQLKQNKEETSS